MSIRRYRHRVHAAEARALVAALDHEFSFPSDDSWVLERRRSVESYAAEQSQDGSWRVVLRWTQGVHAFGTVIEQLTELVMGSTSTAAHVAADYRMLRIEEPHAPVGRQDSTGRVWLQD